MEGQAMTASPAKIVNPAIHERITATANALVDEGIENPTNAQVRACMGGGSLSHISPVMRQWRALRKAETIASLEMPEALRKSVETSLARVWITASKLSSEAIERTQQQARLKIDGIIQERDEALSEITCLEASLLKHEKACDSHRLEANQLKTALEKAHIQNTRLGSENTALTALVSDKDEQIKDLKEALKAARNDSKSIQEELVNIARMQRNLHHEPEQTRRI
jgi:hypothetical protein